MLSKSTIEKVERRCRRVLDDHEVRARMTDAELARVWGAHCALQWVLGGCTWNAGDAVLPDCVTKSAG